MNNLNFHITIFIIYLLFFSLLLFCQPHKKVIKKVTTGNSIRFKIFKNILLRQSRILHTPVDGYPLMLLCGKYFHTLYSWNSNNDFTETLSCALAIHGLCEMPTVQPLLAMDCATRTGGIFKPWRIFCFFLGGAKKKIRKITYIQLNNFK